MRHEKFKSNNEIHFNIEILFKNKTAKPMQNSTTKIIWRLRFFNFFFFGPGQESETSHSGDQGSTCSKMDSWCTAPGWGSNLHCGAADPIVMQWKNPKNFILRLTHDVWVPVFFWKIMLITTSSSASYTPRLFLAQHRPLKVSIDFT